MLRIIGGRIFLGKKRIIYYYNTAFINNIQNDRMILREPISFNESLQYNNRIIVFFFSFNLYVGYLRNLVKKKIVL